MKHLLAQLNMGSSPQVHMPVEKQICKHLLKKITLLQLPQYMVMKVVFEPGLKGKERILQAERIFLAEEQHVQRH